MPTGSLWSLISPFASVINGLPSIWFPSESLISIVAPGIASPDTRSVLVKITSVGVFSKTIGVIPSSVTSNEYSVESII